ncbi:MAG: hypothetical protein M1825_003011 [Sarcosagium campestre]|nr:MAG: hypothetical protein M1825_003011 [Sarcosagium campestre]
MDCAGCEKKLSTAIKRLPHVRNVQTSFVMKEAQFDVDLAACNADLASIVKTIQQKTGFPCELVYGREAVLDVDVGRSMQSFVSQVLPLGVDKILRLGPSRAQISYDPGIIGARDVVRLLLGPRDTLSNIRDDSTDKSKKAVWMSLWMTIFSVLLTIPVLVLAWAPLPDHEILYGAISLSLATVLQVVVVGQFYLRALKAFTSAGMVDMDLLVVISTTAAYIFSLVAFANTAQGTPLELKSFFETSTLLVTLVMCGRVATAYSRNKATESIGNKASQASKVTVFSEDGKEMDIDIRLLQYGDSFRVYPDRAVPTDGTVLSGSTEVDESMLTGEHDLIPKVPGSVLVAGSINKTGAVIAIVRRLPHENTIRNIADMVSHANYTKPKIQNVADRVAAFFVPAILMITVLVLVIWIVLGKTVQDRSTSSAIVNALTYALPVLIVSCPCAIGLAVPMVILIAGDCAAKNGLVFRTGETISTARNISHVIFDKTGTLTQGRPSVVSELCHAEIREDARAIALALTRESKHPVSVAIAAYLAKHDVVPIELSRSSTIVGKGIEAVLLSSQTTVRGGSGSWVGAANSSPVQSLVSRGLTIFCVTRDSKLLVAYGLIDALRPEAKEVVSLLTDRGIKVHIISGDEENATQAVAALMNVDVRNVRGRCSPGAKKEYVERLMASRPKPPTVAFIGDGTNDAPALAQASIGIHVNDGTEVAKSASNVVFLTAELEGILVLMNLSRAVMHRIIFNFVWSFVYNSLSILMAAGAFVHVRVPPAYAGLGELVSVLPVIVVALQLRWSNIRRR